MDLPPSLSWPELQSLATNRAGWKVLVRDLRQGSTPTPTTNIPQPNYNEPTHNYNLRHRTAATATASTPQLKNATPHRCIHHDHLPKPPSTRPSSPAARKYIARDRHAEFFRPKAKGKRKRTLRQPEKKKRKTNPSLTDKQRRAWARDYYEKHHGPPTIPNHNDTFSFSAPLAVALQACSSEFLWGNLFMGQTDVALSKTGEGCYKALRSLLDSCDDELFDLIVFMCTDGASAMRSIPLYAGLDGKHDGDSLHAHMRRNSTRRLPNLHCCTHSLNLANKFALKKCVWSVQWLDHLKAVFNWFSKSPARKAKLKSLHKEMSTLQEVVTWRFVYPKYYCPTRWLGILRALKAILDSSDLLIAYSQTLIDGGYRPDRGLNDDLPPSAEAARVDIDEDYTQDRHHEQSFYKWGTNNWDLIITTPNDREMRCQSEQRRLRLDVGRAQTWKAMRDGVSKKSKLISERCGLTEQMMGLDAAMADALGPYAILVERLQTSIFPIGHNVRQWICQMFKTLDTMFLREDSKFGDNFNKWKNREGVSTELCKEVQRMTRQFVFQFLTNARHRLQPYWQLFLAMETINPCAPWDVSPQAWLGVRDLCLRVGMSEEKSTAVVRELKAQHEGAGEWSLAEVKACKYNLLKYYHDRLAADKKASKLPDYPLANKFATLVFALHVASAVVESYFSKTRYCKSLHRSSLSDTLSSATLHLQQLRPFRDDEVLENAGDLMIDFQKALTVVENSLDDLRRKYEKRKVIKPFYDNDLGEVRNYNGSVTTVDYSSSEGCFLFRVEYDSDSDGEDMEHWELKRYIQE